VNKVTLAEFQLDTPEAAARVWRSAAEGRVLEGEAGQYFVGVTKTALGYVVLASRPASDPVTVLGVSCGCPFSYLWHWHHWELCEEPEKAAEAVAWAVDAISRGVSVKLAHSTQVPF
jgi:hypothetical protein